VLYRDTEGATIRDLRPRHQPLLGAPRPGRPVSARRGEPVNVIRTHRWSAAPRHVCQPVFDVVTSLVAFDGFAGEINQPRSAPLRTPARPLTIGNKDGADLDSGFDS
jgi:hypothetical protein